MNLNPTEFDPGFMPKIPNVMTLRVYLAAKAMGALVNQWHPQGGGPCDQIAKLAVEQADALIAELEKTKQGEER